MCLNRNTKDIKHHLYVNDYFTYLQYWVVENTSNIQVKHKQLHYKLSSKQTAGFWRIFYFLLLSTYVMFILNFCGLMQTGQLYKLLIRLFNFLVSERYKSLFVTKPRS